MFVVQRDNPLIADALKEFEGRYGFDISEALPADQWNVLLPEAPTVSITPDGVRALARMSSNPNALRIAADALACPGRDAPAEAESKPLTLEHYGEVTASEMDAIACYENGTAGIPESLSEGFLDIQSPDEIKSLSLLLDSWWSALDGLDSECGDGVYAPRASKAALGYLREEMRSFFTARQNMLYALAGCAGVKVPRPDHGDDGVETSSHARGWFGYHGLSERRCGRCPNQPAEA